MNEKLESGNLKEPVNLIMGGRNPLVLGSTILVVIIGEAPSLGGLGEDEQHRGNNDHEDQDSQHNTN